MPRSRHSRPSGEPSEKQRFEVPLEEVHSQQRMILEGITELKERMERVEFSCGSS